MLCVLCLIVLWGFSFVTSYSGVIGYLLDSDKRNKFAVLSESKSARCKGGIIRRPVPGGIQR